MGLQFFALLAPLTPKLRLPLKLSHGSAMVVSMAMDLVLDMVDMADTVWDTAMARGQLMLRLMPGTDMVASTATDSQPMVDMAMAVTAMARGLLMLRPSLRLMPGTDMVASTATDSQPMADMAMAVTATARGLLRLRLSHGTDMAVFTATDSQPMVPMVATPMASKDLD